MWVHTEFGKRGQIGTRSKLEPTSKLAMYVGKDPNGMGFRCAMLPGFKIRTALHVAFD